MSLERDIARASRQLREERRIERQEWREIHRFVREHDRRRPLIHNGLQVQGRKKRLSVMNEAASPG